MIRYMNCIFNITLHIIFLSKKYKIKSYIKNGSKNNSIHNDLRLILFLNQQNFVYLKKI